MRSVRALDSSWSCNRLLVENLWNNIRIYSILCDRRTDRIRSYNYWLIYFCYKPRKLARLRAWLFCFLYRWICYIDLFDNGSFLLLYCFILCSSLFYNCNCWQWNGWKERMFQLLYSKISYQIFTDFLSSKRIRLIIG